MAAPEILVPADPGLAYEPARTVGAATAAETTKTYSTVDRLKLFVGTAIGLAVMLGVNIAPGVTQQVQDAITYGAPLATMLYAWWQTERTRREAIAAQASVQAERTREAVYAPATVADIVAAERPAKEVEAVVIPAPAPMVRQ